MLERIQPSLQAANKTFPGISNPVIGLTIDTVFASKRHADNNIEFRSAELGLAASVDPFSKGFAILNGIEHGVEIEEAGVAAVLSCRNCYGLLGL